MKLSKAICRRCFNQRCGVFGIAVCWGPHNERLWADGKVWCAGEVREYSTEQTPSSAEEHLRFGFPPSWCEFMAEHLVSQCD